MSQFRYKAVNAAGDILEGEMEAANREAVVARLHDLGHTPIRADEIKGGSLWGFLTADIGGGRRARPKDVTMITRQLATLLGAGLPLDYALKLLVDLAERKAVSDLLDGVLRRVRSGDTLAQAFEAEPDVFPSDYISMIRAGEAGGALDGVLARLADYLERADELKGTVTSALIYPAILLVLAGGAVVVLLTLVIPQFKPLFEQAGADLPLATQIIVGVGEAIENYWWAMIGAVVFVVFGVRARYARPQTRLAWDRRLLGVPLAGDLAAKVETARFSRMLGTLLGNGVALLNGLAIAQGTLKNAALAQAVGRAAEKVKGGRGLAETLMGEGVFPPLSLHLLRVGEETGNLESMLFKIADIYDDEVKRSIDRLMALLVPALTVVLGVFIAGIIGSIMSAILKVNELAF